MAALDVSTSLPEITLPPGATVTVEAFDPGATVGSMNIKVFQVLPSDPAASSFDVDAFFAHGADD